MQEFAASILTRDPTALKEAARREPVAITEYNRPRFVLMSHEAYVALTAKPPEAASAGRFPVVAEGVKIIMLESPDEPYAP
jgi:PHD/YefM family antitoxin component YafN of YafNO toxin-antitoxin module